MKAIIIARVSTEEQKEAGNSLPAQIVRMEDYCKRNNYQVIQTFSFDESAYKTKRDEFDKIVELINNTNEKLVVCFDKVDRLSRNIFDKRVAMLYEKAVNDRIELHFVSDSQVINEKMNAGDKFAFGMKLGLSKYYSDAISDNVKRAFEQKRRSGEWTGPVRLGYLNISSNQEKRLRKDIIIDPERFHLIQKMFEMYATGNYSLETIRKDITNMGLRTLKGNKLSKSGVENILNDSFYCGIALSKKYGPYNHRYPRIISKDLFDKVQIIRTGRNKKHTKFASKEYIFKGILTCKKCGHTLSPEIHKKEKSGLEYVYYSCASCASGQRHYISEKTLLESVYGVLEAFSGVSFDVQEELVSELRKTNESEVEFHKIQIHRISSEYNLIQGKIDKLLDLHLEGKIGEEDYSKKLNDLKNKQYLLNIELEEHTKADHNYHIQVSTVLSLARNMKQIFESSEISEKRQILNLILQNPTVNEKKLYFTIASPFNLVLDLASHPNWLCDQGSNLGHPP